jgi:hypothetical protein
MLRGSNQIKLDIGHHHARDEYLALYELLAA